MRVLRQARRLDVRVGPASQSQCTFVAGFGALVRVLRRRRSLSVHAYKIGVEVSVHVWRNTWSLVAPASCKLYAYDIGVGASVRVWLCSLIAGAAS